MAPIILRRPSPSLPAASSTEDTSSDSSSASYGDEVEQQPTTLRLRPPPPPAPPHQGEGEGEGEESSSDEEDLELKSSVELVAAKKALVAALPQPQNGRYVSDSDSVDDESPPEPALQAKKNEPPSESDDEEDEDQESDFGDDKEAPPEPALQGKRKTPPPEPEVGESPQRKRQVLQAEVTASMDAAAPAQGDNYSQNTDIEKQFGEKTAFYSYLGKEVSVLDKEHPNLFKEPFLKLADDKASAMDAKIKRMIVAQVRLSMRRWNLEKELVKLLLDLIN